VVTAGISDLPAANAQVRIAAANVESGSRATWRVLKAIARGASAKWEERALYGETPFLLLLPAILSIGRYITHMRARSPEQAAVSSASRLPMSLPAASASERIAYLESIRGLAAIQVLLLHFFFAFVPDLVAPAPSSALAASVHLSPLYFLYDGYSAVYIFFSLSGYVLTRSFERQLDQPPVQILARAVRLGLPALAATAFSASLMLIVGSANVEAGTLLSNAWFSRQWDADLSVLSVVRDGTINALLLGYRDMPGVAFLAPWQQSVSQSFVTPLWTLSIEFYGSIAILFLCWCVRRSRHLWWIAMVLGAVFTIRSAYMCFFAGHLLAVTHRAEGPVSTRKRFPMALAASGVACCVIADVWQPGWLVGLCSYQVHWLFPGQLPPMQQKALGAALVLTGIIDLQVCRNFLSKPWLVVHSKLSFPLYLVHWPIMCGLSATAFVYLNKIVGIELARMCAIALGIAATAAASVVFAAVDRYAVGLSSRLRRRAVVPAEIMQLTGIARPGSMEAAK
jgi:peptidoglycan/LPS O-acetylase OafA/YrhL